MRFAITSLLAICLFISAVASASAAEGKVIKVLPQYLDLKGRTSLSPSLYDRDAYQAELKVHPDQCSGLVFNVQWRAPKGQYKVIIEARGSTVSKTEKKSVWELPVTRHGWFSQWDKVTVTGDEFKQLQGLSAWRVTLWNGSQLIGEQKSFLW